MDISVYINFLLKKKDQAIIPGLGIFNLIKTPASFEEKSNTYLPPSSHIEFIQMDEAEDNEIAMLISLYENLTNDEAAEKTGKISAGIRASLDQEGSYSIQDIGKLTKDENGRIIFTPDILSPSANEFYGMPKVETEKSPAENIKEAAVVVGNVKKEQEPPRSPVRTKKIILLVFLSLFFISIAGCATYIAFNYNESADFIHKEAALINDFLKKLFSGSMNNADTSIVINKDTNNCKEVINKSVTDTLAKLVTDTLKYIGGGDVQSYIIEPGPEKKFYIIAGCFRDLENAGKFIKDLETKNYKPVIAGKTPAGLYRVCYSSGYTSKRDATDEIIKIRLILKNEPWLIEY